jgi:hypothetical protein
MDWAYLFDREEGELFLDIGISWNPVGEEPLVSLWRLDKLDASFGKGGFNMGTIHNISTLARYGGMQAEMSKERSRRTHITYRQSYNLAYEVTRQRTNKADLFDIKEAYVGDGNFSWEVSELVNMYEGKAKERSYGSRDEYRLGGHAVLAIIPQLKDLVRGLNLLHRPVFDMEYHAGRKIHHTQTPLDHAFQSLVSLVGSKSFRVGENSDDPRIHKTKQLWNAYWSPDPYASLSGQHPHRSAFFRERVSRFAQRQTTCG